jgi:hypothetical protein
VDSFILRANQKIRGLRNLRALVLTTLATLILATVRSAPAFADVSPQYVDTAAGASVDDQPVQLAEANLPPVGSVDDYMSEGNPGGPGAGMSQQGYQGVPPQGYQQQGIPPQGYYPQGVPPQEYYGYADPNAERSALIGAAVVGAVAVGMWAWQQHQAAQAQRQATLQAQRQARKQTYPQRRAYNNEIE